MRSTRREVKILNPAGSSCGWTSLKKAREYVRRGRARLKGNTLEFIADNSGHLAAVASDRRCGYDRAASTGMLNTAQMKHIPIIQPEKMLIRRSRRAA